MYALTIVRYRLPIEEIDESYREAHRDYLRGLKKQGLFIASGPFKPHFGGAFLLRVQDADAEVEAVQHRVTREEQAEKAEPHDVKIHSARRSSHDAPAHATLPPRGAGR